MSMNVSFLGQLLPAIAIAGVVGTACQGLEVEPVDVSEESPGTETSEEALSKPPAPANAPPGTLGGICGKQWERCAPSEKMFQIFSRLPYRNLKTSVSWPSNRSWRDGTLTVEVPRLVDDHKQPRDILTLRVTEDPSGLGSNNTVSITRNGTVVHEAKNFVGPQNVEVSIDYNRGGIESWYAIFASSRAWSRLKFDLEKVRVNRSSSSSCSFQGPEIGCWICRGQKFAFDATAGLLTAIGLRGAGLKGDALDVVGGMAGAAGSTGTAIFSCDKLCARAQCEKDLCECTGRGCMDSFARCCEHNGGRVVRCTCGETYCAPGLPG